MGGFGSGRKGLKHCTDDLLTLDIRILHRSGHLKPGASFRWQWKRRCGFTASIDLEVQADRVWLEYKQRKPGQEWQDCSYPVLLDRTPCHLGGERVWWRCPATGCGRRVAVLHGSAVFACRHCHRLTYQSQRETAINRAINRADALRERLGWSRGIVNGEGPKPARMHWQTFERLRAEHNALVNRALGGMRAQLERQRGNLHSVQSRYG